MNATTATAKKSDNQSRPTESFRVKASIKRDSFAHAFQLAASVAPSRSPKPILQHVKLQLADDQSLLLATDLEVGLRLKVDDIEVSSAGAAILPVQRMSMILREVTDDVLTIDATPEKTVIQGQHSRFELAGQNPDEFPEVATFEERDYFEVGADVLRRLIQRTIFATESESSRYALGGILLESDGNVLIAVGTDGRRLAKMEGPVKKVGQPNAGATTIVPARAMQLLERMLPAGDAVVHLCARTNELLVRDERCEFCTRLVEGRFPRWRDVIPKRGDSQRIEIPVGQLLSTVRQAAIVASEESRGIDFGFADGTLVLSNATADIGQSRIEMPVAYDGPALTISLDHRYVADFLKVLPLEKTFTLDVVNSELAAYCSTDDKYGYVIMPMARDRR
jgi:DNA polymerase-3 subunit beta